MFPADTGRAQYAELVLRELGPAASDKAYANAVSRFVAALVKGTDGAIEDPSGATQIMEQATQYKSNS